MKNKEIINLVAEELNLCPEVVNYAYRSYWEFIRKTIKELPLSTISEQEFATLRTNFNIPALGKLYSTFDRIKGVKKRLSYINNIKKDVKD